MPVTFKDYINTLKSGRYQPIAKISWLRREDESIYGEFTAHVLDGNLSISKNNGIRRSLNLVLDNSKKQFIPSEDSIWIRSKFFLEMGLKINGEDFLFPQGVFVLSDPELISETSKSTINIKADDKFSLLNGNLGGEIDSIYEIPAGSNILNAIRSLLGIAEDRRQPILQNTNEITPYTIRHEYGSNYGNILTELAGLLSYDIYYDELGHLKFEKPVDSKSLASEWDYTTDELLYLGANRSYKFSEIYNRVLVIGANINGDIATGLVENKNLLSPTRVQLIGSRTKIIQDDIISTDNLAIQRAEYELNNITKLQESINLSSIPIFHFDVGKLITINDKTIDLNEDEYIIQGMSMNVNGKGNMNLTVWKSN